MTIIAFNHDRTDETLVGVWKLESRQTNGQPERRERELWVFKHGTLTIVRDDNSHNAKISVDPSASPKHLDTDIMFLSTGIYAIDGDTLRVSQVVQNMPRPTGFKTTWGDMRTVSLFRRLNADPRIPSNELHDLLLTAFGPATEYPDRIEFDEEADEFISDLMRDIYDRAEEMIAKEEYDKAGEMTATEEVVWHVSWLMTEVNNGGFHQFFYNSTGENAIETAALLRKIGAPQTAALVETGCNLFPEGAPSKNYQERRAQLERFTLDQLETLDDLDERFYSRREDLSLLLKKYWEGEPGKPDNH